MKNNTLRTTAITSLSIYLITFVTGFLGTAIAFLLGYLGILSWDRFWLFPLIPVITSLLLGHFFSQTVGKRFVRFVEQVNESLKQIAKGNYDVKLEGSPPAQEIREIIQNFNHMTEELAATEMLRNDFVQNVSHEFKTPLTAIEGYATLLQQENLSEEKRQEYTQKILQSTRRLNALAGNVLLLSRLENQELEIQPESYSLDEQIREVILLLEQAWTAKNLELDIQLDDCECSANPALMAHVWQNLLSNAIKFSPDSGVIGILLQHTPDGIRVSVSDQGPGMTGEVMHRVFEKFYQGDTTRSTQGNGLGLSLAKRIVDLHGGTIAVDSQPGHGAIFTVTLPN